MHGCMHLPHNPMTCVCVSRSGQGLGVSNGIWRLFRQPNESCLLWTLQHHQRPLPLLGFFRSCFPCGLATFFSFCGFVRILLLPSSKFFGTVLLCVYVRVYMTDCAGHCVSRTNQPTNQSFSLIDRPTNVGSTVSLVHLSSWPCCYHTSCSSEWRPPSRSSFRQS